MFNYTQKHEFPHSTSIAAVYYDEPTKILVVNFTNGNEAAYHSVEPHRVASLTTAISVGSYYNSWIKGRYQGVPAPHGPYAQRGSATEAQAAPTSTNKFKVSGVVTFDVSDVLVDADTIADAVAKFEEALKKAVFANGSVNSTSLDVSSVVKA